MRRLCAVLLCLALAPTAALAGAVVQEAGHCPHSTGGACDCAKMCRRKAPEPVEELPACHRAAREQEPSSTICSPGCGGHGAPDLNLVQETRFGPTDVVEFRFAAPVSWVLSTHEALTLDAGLSPPHRPPRPL